MDTCPSCDASLSYFSHQSLGLTICNGCADNICVKCHYGARYCCAYFRTLLRPPSAPLSRQCSTEKWEMAEEYLHQHPTETQTIADAIPGKHVYIVRRTDAGELVREHYALKDVEKE
jgi:hypothetical protein